MVESSSVIFSKISGSEFARAPVTFKGNKKLSVAVCVPDIELYGDSYVYAWDKMRVDQNDLYLAMCSNLNKFIDQSISYNFYMNLANGVKVDELKVLNTLFIKPAREGIKTTYYLNFNTDNDEEDDSEDNLTQEEKEFQALLRAAQGSEESGCAGGGCSL